MQLVARFKTLALEETFLGRRQRMLPSALYGILIASSYILVGGTINQLSFPDLPISVDWHTLFLTWCFFTLWLGVGGLFINWFTYTEESLPPGLLVMIVMALGEGALTFDGNLPTQLGKLLLLALPTLGMSVTMTITLRWLGVRHAQIIGRKKLLLSRDILTLTAIACTIGGLSGFAMTRWSGNTLNQVRFVNHNLQMAAADPARASELFPLKDLPGLPSHLNVPYTLQETNSVPVIETVEVITNFKDGYQFTCLTTVIIPTNLPTIITCAERGKVLLPD